MVKKIDILNIEINNVGIDEARDIVESFLTEDKAHLIVTPNAEQIVRAQREADFARILNQADLVIPDGAGLLMASRLLKNRFKERVAGYDLMNKLVELAAEKGYSIYLLGGKPGIVDRVKARLLDSYSNLKIRGTHHGYLDETSEERVVQEINQVKPDILFVGMGVPLQERFLDRNLARLEVKAAMAVGGSFDVQAGELNRAPLWVQKAYLEWLYRLLQEPSRLGRMMALPRFVYLVIREVVKKRG